MEVRNWHARVEAGAIIFNTNVCTVTRKENSIELFMVRVRVELVTLAYQEHLMVGIQRLKIEMMRVLFNVF